MLNVVEDEDETQEEQQQSSTTGTTTRELSCKLNDTEVRERGEEMAREKKEIERLEARRKSLNASIRAKADRITELAKAINERVEVREVLCEWRADYQNKRHDLIRTDTGAVLQQRAMTAADMQTRLPGVDRATAEQREDAEDAAEDEVDDELADGDDDDLSDDDGYAKQAAELDAAEASGAFDDVLEEVIEVHPGREVVSLDAERAARVERSPKKRSAVKAPTKRKASKQSNGRKPGKR